MKKMLLNKLNAYALTKEEKKKVAGGLDMEFFDPTDCTPRGCECIDGFIRCKWYNPSCSYPDVMIPCGDPILS